MANLTGRGLLDQLMQNSGVQLSTFIQNALVARLDAEIEAGNTSPVAITAIVSNAAPAVREAYPSTDDMNNAVDEVKEVIAAQPEPDTEPGDAPTFMLTEAIAAQEAGELPEGYEIDAEAVFTAEDVTVEAAAATLANVQAILDGAANSEDLVLADLFTWTVADTLENLEGADLTGAASYSLINEAGALGILTEEQAALVEGAENTADYSFTAVGEAFTLAEATEFVAAADVTASKVEITATNGVLADSKTFKIQVGDDAVEVTDLNVPNGGVALATALNADTGFTNAGLNAVYAGGKLTITQAEGKALSAVELLDGGAALAKSEAEISILQGVLVGSADQLNLTLDGETIEVRDINNAAERTTTKAVADYIQAQIRAYETEDADGETIKPFSAVTVAHTGGKLVITDDAGRAFSNISLHDTGDAAVDSIVRIPLTTAQAQEADLFEIQLGEHLVKISIEATSATDLAAKLQAAVKAWTPEGSGETPFAGVTVAYSGTNNRLTITDNQGREVSLDSVKLQGEPQGVQDSKATISGITTGIANNDVGRLNAKIGSVEVELAAVDTSTGLTGLAANIQAALRAADKNAEDITATVVNNTIEIVDAKGREISLVELTTSGATASATEWKIANLVGTQLSTIDVFKIKVPGLNDNKVIEVKGDALETGSQTDFATSIETALNKLVVDGSEPFKVAFGTGDAANTLIIKDVDGRELSDIQVQNTQGAVASVVDITGLSNAISRLDAQNLSIKIGDKQIDVSVNVDETDGDTAALATAIAGKLNAALGGDNITASAINNGAGIRIHDADGRTLSNVKLTTADTESEATVVTLYGVAEENADAIKAFEATTQVLDTNGLLQTVKVVVDLRTTTSAENIATAIQNAFNAATGADNVITINYNDADTDAKVGPAQAFILTNTQGYGISDVKLTSDAVAETSAVVTIALTDAQVDTTEHTLTLNADATPVTITATPAAATAAALATALETALKNEDEGYTVEVVGGNLVITGPEGVTLSEISLMNAAQTAAQALVDQFTAQSEAFTEAQALVDQFTAQSEAFTEAQAAVTDHTDQATAFTTAQGVVADLTTMTTGIQAVTWTTDEAGTKAAHDAITAQAVTGGAITEAQKTAIDTAFADALTGETELVTAKSASALAYASIVTDANTALTEAAEDLFVETTAPDDLGGVATEAIAAELSARETARTDAANDLFVETSVPSDLSGDLSTAIGDELTARETARTEAAEDLFVETTAPSDLSGDLSTAIGDELTARTEARDEAGLNVGGAPSVTAGSAFAAGTTSVAEEIVTTQAGNPEGVDGEVLGTVTITNGHTADARPGTLVFGVGDVAELVEAGVTAGTGAAAIPQQEVAYQAGTEGVRADVGDPAVLHQQGVEAGLNADQVGGNPVITNGVEAGTDPRSVITEEALVITNGNEATDGAAWTATFEVNFADELEEAYTFTLSLTEVLGEEAEEGAEAAVVVFTLEAEVGQTAADVVAAMVATIDADALFSAFANDEDQLVVTADDAAVNFTVDLGVELTGVVEDLAGM